MTHSTSPTSTPTPSGSTVRLALRPAQAAKSLGISPRLLWQPAVQEALVAEVVQTRQGGTK